MAKMFDVKTPIEIEPVVYLGCSNTRCLYNLKGITCGLRCVRLDDGGQCDSVINRDDIQIARESSDG